MAVGARCPIAEFDHNAASHAADTTSGWKKLRDLGELVWTNAHGGYWVSTSYDAVFNAARDADNFCSGRPAEEQDLLAAVIPKRPMHRHLPNEADPPEHRQFRLALNQLMSPRAVADLAPLIEKHVTWFLDEIIEDGRCDLAEVLKVPTLITVEWLGLPMNDWPRYASAHHSIMMSDRESPQYAQAVNVDFPYLWNQMREAIANRRLHPNGDVISVLTDLTVDGKPITDEEVFGMVELLLSGGVNTTAGLVSQALVWLYEHPDVRQELLDDPTLIDHAVEEFLRYFSPNQAISRTVAKDTELAGCQLQTGERFLLGWASANRDPKAFDEPDTVDIHRWPNRHLAFGLGIHRCAGSHLGRSMGRELLRQILDRMPDYEIDMSRVEIYENQGVHSGYLKIPAAFTPGPRRGAPGPSEHDRSGV